MYNGTNTLSVRWHGRFSSRLRAISTDRVRADAKLQARPMRQEIVDPIPPLSWIGCAYTVHLHGDGLLTSRCEGPRASTAPHDASRVGHGAKSKYGAPYAPTRVICD